MAKQAQLVSQHLENISHEALSKYQDVIRSHVRVWAAEPLTDQVGKWLGRGIDICRVTYEI